MAVLAEPGVDPRDDAAGGGDSEIFRGGANTVFGIAAMASANGRPFSSINRAVA